MEQATRQPMGPALPVLDPATGAFKGGAPVAVEPLPGPRPEQPFVRGAVPSKIGAVPRVDSRLERADRLGAWRVRWSIGRGRYRVDPGLYALGSPDGDSPVLVSANYKLSFDRLRSALPGRSAWILVLDTDGVNVWCAAGKGTFGTDELIRRVLGCRLAEVVAHRRLILPQLSGPGVAARKVERACGFEAVFGPVRASDLPAFLDGGHIEPGMRRVTFGLAERAVLVPVELVSAARRALPIGLVLFFLAGLGWPGGYWAATVYHGGLLLAALAAALLAGAVLHPLLLPWLPPRSFSAKGLLLGLLLACGLGAGFWPRPLTLGPLLELAGLGAALAGLSSFLAMNFTGSSTFTSLSGVRREMRWAVPLQIALVGLGVLVWIAARFFA